MSRNASGTYSLPAGNPVVSGTTISSTTHNNTLGDIAAELTDSLSRSGKGGMTSPLRTADGSVNAPAHSFTNDTDCGLYRKGANNPAMAVNEVERQEWTTAGSKVTGTFEATSTVTCADATDATHAVTKGQMDALAAGDIANTPAGGIAATDVQAALNELDTEKAPLASPTFTGTVTVPTPVNATDAVTKAYVDTTSVTITAGTGWGTTSVYGRRAGKVVHLSLNYTNTAGSGAWTSIATIPADALPVTILYPLGTVTDASTGLTYSAQFSVHSVTGVVSLYRYDNGTSMVAAAALSEAVNDNVYLVVTYVIP